MRIRGMFVGAAVAGLTLAGGLCGSRLPQAEARPQYLKTFEQQYDHLKKQAETNKCGVCHVGSSKKERNDYGKALDKTLKTKNEKDVDAIKKLMKQIEGQESNVKGKTWGDVLKNGLP